MKFTYEATLKWISTLDNASALILKSVNSCLFEGYQKYKACLILNFMGNVNTISFSGLKHSETPRNIYQYNIPPLLMQISHEHIACLTVSIWLSYCNGQTAYDCTIS